MKKKSTNLVYNNSDTNIKSMKKLKEYTFNKQELKSNINSYLSELNNNFNSLLFKLSPLVYKFRHKSSNEVLYGMKVISTKYPNIVLRFNVNLDFSNSIHSISCWKNYYPINRKYPTPDFVIDGFNEDQIVKEQSDILQEISVWLKKKSKQSYFLNSESMLSVDSMLISDMNIQKEINDIFNLSKDSFTQKDELSANIEDIKNTNDSIVLVLNDIDNQEEKQFVIQEIKSNIEVVSGINYFIKKISTDELAIALWLNHKKNNEIIILDNFTDWDNRELLDTLNEIITKGEITYQFKEPDLKPSDFPEDGKLDFTVKFIIITPDSEEKVNSKDYTFLNKNTSYEELYIDDNEQDVNLKMQEILPNFLPKLSSSFKKRTIQEILKLIDITTVNITIPELILLLEIRLVCKNSWEDYFKNVLENLPKT